MTDDPEYPAIIIDETGEKPPRVGQVKASQIKGHGPIYPPLVDMLASDFVPERRAIPAAELHINARFRPPAAAVVAMVKHIKAHRLLEEEFMTVVLVMQRRNGTLWVYDDTLRVAAMQQVDPTAPLPCAVYQDPTR